MDLSDTIHANSDQMDAVDLPQPRTFTIDHVEPGPSKDQPVNVHLREFNRPWRPAKTVRRILVALWGADGAKYAGQRLTLFNDPAVMFGGIACGGIRVSHASGIDEPLKIALLVKRGKSELFTIQPLREPVGNPDRLPTVTPAQIDACTDEGQLREWWQSSDDATRAIILERVQILSHEQEASQS